ncbi:unnamed protein product [Pleuronectes platessa]|uniref:Uncharacterized protein n=1 Tax=Pleuronectes platessa TaxID=8262 RepID=A0A9N7UT07_PLEPL|nr:unnamed protein product [Pleuronectes platessa]
MDVKDPVHAPDLTGKRERQEGSSSDSAGPRLNGAHKGALRASLQIDRRYLDFFSFISSFLSLLLSRERQLLVTLVFLGRAGNESGKVVKEVGAIKPVGAYCTTQLSIASLWIQSTVIEALQLIFLMNRPEENGGEGKERTSGGGGRGRLDR